MNTLPSHLKTLISDYLFAAEQQYNQYIPSKAIDMAKDDLKQVIKLRVLSNGDSNFLRNRFKVTKPIDTCACTQARQSLVFSILRFKHLDGKWFTLPLLKTEKNRFERFIIRYNDQFSDETFKHHRQSLEKLTAKVLAFRRRQAYILRLLKRDH